MVLEALAGVLYEDSARVLQRGPKRIPERPFRGFYKGTARLLSS